MRTFEFSLRDGHPGAAPRSRGAHSVELSLDQSYRLANQRLMGLLACQVSRDLPPLACDLLDVAQNVQVRKALSQ